MLLHPQQMFSYHIAVNPPAVGQTNQRAKTDFVDPCAAQPVRRFQSPEEILLFPLQMVASVNRLMITLLIHHHAIQPQRLQLCIFSL